MGMHGEPEYQSNKTGCPGYENSQNTPVFIPKFLTYVHFHILLKSLQSVYNLLPPSIKGIFIALFCFS